MIKEIWNIMRVKNPDRKDPNRKSKKKAPDNIYIKNGSHKQLHKTYHWIHFVFKYKFFIPAIWLIKGLLNKYLIKKIDKQPHNTNMRLFNEAYEEAIKKWILLYRRNGETPQRSIKFWMKTTKDPSNQAIVALRTMKEFILTLSYYDTAYREMFNILMHEIHHKMHEEYSNKEKYPEGTAHLFYAQRDAYDVHYKYLFKQLQVNVRMQLVDAMEQIKKAAEEEKKIREPKEEKS